jgi:hypothetical protein
MSEFRMKGVLDRFGWINWILMRDGDLAQPIAVIADYKVTQLLAEMDEQRSDLDAFRFRTKNTEAAHLEQE